MSEATVRFLDHPAPMRTESGGHLGTRKIERQGRLLRATGPERTLVEGFRRPGLAGGLEELVTSASGFAVLDLTLLDEILQKYSIANLWAATGWFLERFRETFHVPEEFLSHLERHRPSVPHYVERNRRGGGLRPAGISFFQENCCERKDRMNPSREYLQACSIQTGYQIAPLEKVVRLGEMAGDITRHPFLGKVLALKGGTALNLCFGPPKRLSVDLDYNYVGNLEREKMLEDRPRVEAAIYELSRRRGYQPQRSADSLAGRKFFLTYRSVVGRAWIMTHPLLSLEPNEKEYVAGILRGDLLPHLLFCARLRGREKDQRTSCHPVEGPQCPQPYE